MKNQTFLGVFLIIIGALGLIVGLITGHFMDSPGQTALYVLPVLLGIVMIIIDRTGKKK